MGIDLEVIAAVVGFGVVILYRIECLGRQIGAVDASIRSDVAHTEADRTAIYAEWKENHDRGAKEAHMFWVFWAAVGAVLIGWKLWSG
jgi:hypothetical protein